MNQTNAMKFVLDSLFLSLSLTEKFKNEVGNKRLQRITEKSWRRHWRRVAKAQAFGFMELAIPEEATR